MNEVDGSVRYQLLPLGRPVRLRRKRTDAAGLTAVDEGRALLAQVRLGTDANWNDPGSVDTICLLYGLFRCVGLQGDTR